MNKKQLKLDEINEAVAELLTILKPSDTVHTILRHTSRSGMMRHISLVVHKDNEVNDITYLAAQALDENRADNGGIKQAGCGTDMGFNLVYNLGLTLWPDGTNTPHGTRNGQPDYNGGYALKQAWL